MIVLFWSRATRDLLKRLRLEDNRGFEHGGEQPIEPDEDQAICSAEPEPPRRGSLQDDKLLATA